MISTLIYFLLMLCWLMLWFGFMLSLGVVAATLFFQLRTGVPPVPSFGRERRQLLQLLAPLKLEPGGVIYDLGSGWGGVLLLLSKAYPNHTIRGIELSWLPYWVSRFRCRHLENVEVVRANFYDHDVRDASLVVNYLMRSVMDKLAIKLDQALYAGTPVVNIAFWFDHRSPTQTIIDPLPGVALYHWPALDAL